MALEADAVDRALAADAAWLAELRERWGALVKIVVWGRLASARIGALPRLRKRVLELGEKLAALGAPREWIPRPRERLKSALAAALAARALLEQCAQALDELDAGDDREALARSLAALREVAEAQLEQYAGRWAALLDSQLGEREME